MFCMHSQRDLGKQLFKLSSKWDILSSFFFGGGGGGGGNLETQKLDKLIGKRCSVVITEVQEMVDWNTVV